MKAIFDIELSQLRSLIALITPKTKKNEHSQYIPRENKIEPS